MHVPTPLAISMASFSSLSLFLIFAILLFHSYLSVVQCRNLPLAAVDDDGDKLRTYIVHVRPTFTTVTAGSLEDYHRSFLPTTLQDSAGPRLIYSYTEVFSGFVAKLTGHEVDEMAKKEGFVRAYPNQIIPLRTTHTPAFLGLQSGSGGGGGGGGVWNSSRFGEGVIIGLLDTGITPDHPSFSDEGMPAPPAKWEGTCELRGGCNKKIIGARAYGESANDPSDDLGHGTHTSATAAGSAVPGVNAFGLGTGSPTGMAPKAHIAMYKVCTASGCPSADILAGLDDAVKDGVDVLSLSIGGDSVPYLDDPLAIGTFGATQKGIVVVCGAGNSGPSTSTLSNEAPWMLTVAASSVDRSFRSTVHLGNGKSFDGETLYQPANFTTSRQLPLVFPGDNGNIASVCDSLEGFDVKGKIVVCAEGSVWETDKSQVVKSAGGAGMVLINLQEQGYSIFAVAKHAIPTVHISFADAEEVITYLRSNESPTASISFNGTVLGTSPAPTVAFFSSRGPSQQSAGILKPDVSAPGVNILAAWHTNAGGSSTEGEFGYNVISGTSMATPHVSGIAALLRSLHPDWSPAAIRSAIVTTSDTVDRDGNPIKDEQHQAASFYAMGAGHINPPNAAEPGLVYDLDVEDYIGFLCGLGLADDGIGAIVRLPNASCGGVKKVSEFELNYPTITVSPGATVNRTVTNVGAANAKYTVEVEAPAKGVTVKVEPQTLHFSKTNEKLTYSVSVSGSGTGEGNLRWVSGKVVVRSPLVIVIPTNQV